MRHGVVGGLAVAVAAVAFAGAPAASQAQALDPSVILDRTGTAAGEQMLVTGDGWAPGSSVVVELCGHGGLSGSVDCDVAHQATAGAGETGSFAVVLTVGLPPVPCPCVVKATDQTSAIAASTGIAVAGVATVPITGETAARPVRQLEITDIDVAGRGWAELFGAPARRRVVVTVVNTGTVAIDEPELAMRWGRGGRPSGVIASPALPSLEPGETATVEVDVERGLLAIGQYTATVELQGVGAASTAAAHDGAYPWGLVALGLVALQVGLLRLRNRLRRRVVPAEPAPVAAPTVLDVASTVIDLTSPDLPELETVARAESERAQRASQAQVAELAAEVEAARVTAARHERAAETRLAEAVAIVRDAQARAAELLVSAQAAATEMALAAAADREEARLALQRVEAHGRALLEAGPREGYGELDRRLAEAVVRALSS